MTVRARALIYVRELLRAYITGLRSGRLPDRVVPFYENRRRALGHDVEVMQAEGPEGEDVARGWCRVAGL